MADAKTIIDEPQGRIITHKTKDGKTIARLDWHSGFKEKYTKSYNKKQAYIDQECIRRMAPLTPKRTGVLIKSATLGTKIGEGEIHQIAPYARRMYYEPMNFTDAPERGNHWFERMKNRHKKSILKGAQKIE